MYMIKNKKIWIDIVMIAFTTINFYAQEPFKQDVDTHNYDLAVCYVMDQRTEDTEPKFE